MLKNVIKNYRYWVLLVVGFVAAVGLFSVPQDELPTLSWLWVLVSTKAVGVGAIYLYSVLIKHWEKRGTIPEFTQFTKDF